MGFSQKSLDFLFENRLNDSKLWFEEHREEYKRLVSEPFAELANALAPVFSEIDSGLVCTPRRVSRVYRDTRFSNDKTMFRDHVWLNVSRPKRDRFDEPPGFYVGISQTGLGYGCGFYSAGTKFMSEMRELILNNDESFSKALKAYENQNVFIMDGEMYKRDRYPDETDARKQWLNRKNIFFSCDDSREALFSENLAQRLKEDFPLIADVYAFLLKTYQQKN